MAQPWAAASAKDAYACFTLPVGAERHTLIPAAHGPEPGGQYSDAPLAAAASAGARALEGDTDGVAVEEAVGEDDGLRFTYAKSLMDCWEVRLPAPVAAVKPSVAAQSPALSHPSAAARSTGYATDSALWPVATAVTFTRTTLRSSEYVTLTL